VRGRTVETSPPRSREEKKQRLPTLPQTPVRNPNNAPRRTEPGCFRKFGDATSRRAIGTTPRVETTWRCRSAGGGR
jgi:hypothetical protein